MLTGPMFSAAVPEDPGRFRRQGLHAADLLEAHAGSANFVPRNYRETQ